MISGEAGIALKTSTPGNRKGDRYARQHRIERLNPKTDYLEITRLFYADFRSVMLALPFAGFMTTFAAPRMSRILSSTGEIEHRFTKRAVDTSLVAAAIFQHGFGSAEGRDLASRVNKLHQQYGIHQDDFVLIGCDTPLFSLEMAVRFGWRKVTQIEREALRFLYDRQARAFGSRRSLPAEFDEMQQYVSNYFDTQLHFEPQNLRMANIALNWYVNLAPRLARPLIRTVLLGVLDPRVIRACGLPVPGKVARLVTNTVMRIMGRRDPVPDDAGPDTMSALARMVYPNGYDFDMLGPQCPMGHSASNH